MKLSYKAFGVCLLLLLLPATAAVADAITLSADQVKQLTTNCTTIKNSLEELEKSDTVARINRGRDYDQVLNQINALNARFSRNSSNQPQFGQATIELQATIAQFRNEYTLYEDNLSDLTKIDCLQKPQDFYNQLVKTRDSRNAVGSQVDAISALMDRYRQDAVTYQATLQGGTSQ